MSATALPSTGGGTPPRALRVLALNCGSSSFKFGLYAAREGAVTTLHEAGFSVQPASRGADHTAAATAADGPAAWFARAVDALAAAGLPVPDIIGHRFVHGGPHLREHCLLDARCRRLLVAASTFAPLHMPLALAVAHAARARWPDLTQVACFDTAFHADMPDVARVLPLPRSLRAAGIERYGFHGLSCASIMGQLGAPTPSRVIIAHLGHGASVTAVADGHSIDTSMGLTPSGGVVMGTRSGDLDPGVLIYLLRELHYDADSLAKLIDERTGLLGISGLSGDLRVLQAAADADPCAALAVRIFCYTVRKEIAAMTAALGGLDSLVFTGGIGENDAEVRAAICAGLGFCGVRLDAARNRACANPLQAHGTLPTVVALPAREGEQIARDVRALVQRV